MLRRLGPRESRENRGDERECEYAAVELHLGGARELVCKRARNERLTGAGDEVTQRAAGNRE